MSIAERIRALRKQSGLTQQQLAEKVQTSQVMINRIELGRIAPSIVMANQIADALGCKIEDLVRSTPENQKKNDEC